MSHISRMSKMLRDMLFLIFNYVSQSTTLTNLSWSRNGLVRLPSLPLPLKPVTTSRTSLPWIPPSTLFSYFALKNPPDGNLQPLMTPVRDSCSLNLLSNIILSIPQSKKMTWESLGGTSSGRQSPRYVSLEVYMCSGDSSIIINIDQQGEYSACGVSLWFVTIRLVF